MNKDKRIDEMAKDLCHTDTCEIKKIGIPCNHRCKAHIYATRAIEKDYRKADEVAREIFEEIDSILVELYYILPSYPSKDALVTSKTFYDELKKKYIKQSEG